MSAHEESLRRAAENDRSIVTLWRTVQPDVATLAQGSRSSALKSVFGESSREAKAGKAPVNLLDLDDDSPSNGGREGVLGREEGEVRALIDEVEANMKRLEAVRAEQKEVLNDLKQKVSLFFFPSRAWTQTDKIYCVGPSGRRLPSSSSQQTKHRRLAHPLCNGTRKVQALPSAAGCCVSGTAGCGGRCSEIMCKGRGIAWV